MEYVRIASIDNPYFAAMHKLLSDIFPKEEVLAFELWKDPLEDPAIHVYVAVKDGEVIGATEYRYDPILKVAMTDFTIIGAMGEGVGRFLYVKREADLERLQLQSGTRMIGMFAEIYNPEAASAIPFGNRPAMHPAVRREVLSHLGYRKLDITYVHPSWDHEGQAVQELDLGFRPFDEALVSIPAALVVRFLRQYYAALPNKPQQWLDMIDGLEERESVALLPL